MPWEGVAAPEAKRCRVVEVLSKGPFWGPIDPRFGRRPERQSVLQSRQLGCIWRCRALGVLLALSAGAE